LIKTSFNSCFVVVFKDTLDYRTCDYLTWGSTLGAELLMVPYSDDEVIDHGNIFVESEITANNVLHSQSTNVVSDLADEDST
jgi:hypothetical protein